MIILKYVLRIRVNNLSCIMGEREIGNMTTKNKKNKQKNFVGLVIVVVLAVLMVMPVGAVKAWPADNNFVNPSVEFNPNTMGNITLNDISAPPYYRVAFTDKDNQLRLDMANNGQFPALVQVDIYSVGPDGVTQTFLKTVNFGAIPGGHEKSRNAFLPWEDMWQPSERGRNWIHGEIFVKWFHHERINVGNFTESFNVVPGWRPVIYISHDWVINEPLVVENKTIIVDGDVYVNAPTVMNNGTLAAGNFTVSNSQTIGANFDVDLLCSRDGEFKAEVKPSGNLTVYGKIWNNPQSAHYWFYMNGTLNLDGGAGGDNGVIENTYGPDDLSRPGGVICTTDNVYIGDGAEIRNGRTHGLYLMNNSKAFIDGANIHDNGYGIGGDGIVCVDGASPTITGNTEVSWNGRHGIMADGALPNIDNVVVDNNYADGIVVKDVTSAYGRPDYTPGTDVGTFIWWDETGWHLRFVSDSLAHDFNGTVEADGDAFTYSRSVSAGEEKPLDIGDAASVTFYPYIDGAMDPQYVFIGQSGVNPPAFPVTLHKGEGKISNCTVSENMDSGIVVKNSNAVVGGNNISDNGKAVVYYADMENTNGMNNWKGSGFWHRVNSGAVNAPEWNMSHSGDWSWWYGNQYTGTYQSKFSVNEFTEGAETAVAQFNYSSVQTVTLSLPKDQDAIVSSEMDITGFSSSAKIFAASDVPRPRHKESFTDSYGQYWNISYTAYLTNVSVYIRSTDYVECRVEDSNGAVLGVDVIPPTREQWVTFNYPNITIFPLQDYRIHLYSSSDFSWYYEDVDQVRVFSERIMGFAYPHNPSIDIGNDGDGEWSYSGEFTNTVRLTDANTNPEFTQELKDYIGSHPSDGNGYVQVPIAISSESPGIILLSNLNITYDYQYTNGSLVSPQTNIPALSSGSHASLVFWSWYDTDTTGTATDQRWINVSADGYYLNTQLNGEPMRNWTRHVIDITSFLGHQIKLNFTFDTVNDADNAHQGWYIDDVEIITTSNYVSSIETEFAGIRCDGADGAVVSNNTINPNPIAGIGILLLSTSSTLISDNIVNNCFMGVRIYSSNYNRISGNTISNTEYGFGVLHDSSNNSIANNTASNNNIGIQLYDFSSSNTLSDNNASSNTWYGIELYYQCVANTIVNNIASNNNYGIYLYYSSSNNIANNTVCSNNHYGICLSGLSNSNKIANNIASDNSQDGICLYHSSSDTITNNTASNNDYYGIYLYYYSSSNTIADNAVSYNRYHGLFLYSSSSNIITNNNALNNWDGILLSSSSNSNTIANNSISNNTHFGLYLSSSSSNTISNNTIGTAYHFVKNETVYGPASAGDTGPLYLDNENILDCTLYVDTGSEWVKLEEWTDYTLNYDTGEIDTSAIEPFGAGWAFYAYYNYSTPGGNGYGIYSINSDSTVANNTIIANEEDGIYINDSGDYSLNSRIENNTIVGNHQGINIFNGSAVITDNDVFSNLGAGIFLESATGEISLNRIAGNNAPGHWYPPEWYLTGIDMRSCDNVSIDHNSIENNGNNIYLSHSTNISIEWNTISDASAVIQIYPTPPPPRGIYSISSQMVVSNNTIYGTIFGMDIQNANADTIIRDNHFSPLQEPIGSPQPNRGIYLTNASVVIERNTFESIGTAIYCTENSSAVIENNTMTNGSIGIHSIWSSPTIKNNTIYGNYWGIYSEFAAPTNAGTNGDQLAADNPGLSNNSEGRMIQIWCVAILVQSSDGSPLEGVYVEVYPNGQATAVYDGYTDASGLTAHFIAVQYLIESDGTVTVLNPHLVLCDGVVRWATFDQNGIYTVQVSS